MKTHWRRIVAASPSRDAAAALSRRRRENGDPGA
jgi:hypothetical protein